MAATEHEQTPYARVHTKQYIDRAPGPLADLGAPWDQFGWFALSIAAGVVLVFLVIGAAVGDALDVSIPGVVIGVALGYWSTTAREPYLKQLEAYLERRRRYAQHPPANPLASWAPAPLPARPPALGRNPRAWGPGTAAWAAWGATVGAAAPRHALVALGGHWAMLTAPAPSWKVLGGKEDMRGNIAGGGLSVDDDGLLTRPDGRLVEVRAVQALNLSGRDDDDQARILSLFADAAALLAPEQRARVVIDNRAVRGDAALAELDRRQRGVPGHLPTAVLLALEKEWYARRYATDIPDRRAYLTLEARRPVGLEAVRGRFQRDKAGLAEERRTEFGHYLAEVTRFYTAMGLDNRRLTRAEVDDLLVRSMAAAPTHDGAPPEGMEPRRAVPGKPTLTELHAATTALDLHERAGYLTITGPWGVRYARSLYVTRLRQTAYPGWVKPLLALPHARIALTIEGRDQNREAGRVERLAGKALALNDVREDRTGGKKVKLSRAEAEHRRTLDETEDPDTNIFRFSLIVTVLADSPAQLQRRVALAKAALRGAKCGIGQGWFDQLELYRATLPTADGGNLHLLRDMTAAVATTFPYHTDNPGHTSGMPLGVTADTHEPVYLDLDAPDIATQQVGIFGVPNSGKSVIMNELTKQTLAEGNGAVVFDSTGSYRPLCEVWKGTYLTLLDTETGATPPALNPWQICARLNPEARVSEMLTLHETFFGRGENVERLTSWQYATLAQAIRAVYARDRGPDEHPYPLERELIVYLKGLKVAAARKVELENMMLGFSEYVGDGIYASLADREMDADVLAQMVVLDVRHCKGKIAVAAFRIMEGLMELRTAARAHLKRVDGRPAMEAEVIDEGHNIIDVAAEHIGQITLQSRHKRRRVLFGTQYITHMKASPRALDMLNTLPVLIVCNTRNEQVGVEAGSAWLAKTLGITEREAGELPGLHVVPPDASSDGYAQAYVIVRSQRASIAKRGKVNLEIPDVDLALFKTQPAERDERDAWTAAHGGLWPGVVAATMARRARWATGAALPPAPAAAGDDPAADHISLMEAS